MKTTMTSMENTMSTTSGFKIKQTCPTCRKEADESLFKINGFKETTHTHYLSDDDEWLFDD